MSFLTKLVKKSRRWLKIVPFLQDSSNNSKSIKQLFMIIINYSPLSLGSVLLHDLHALSFVPKPGSFRLQK